MKIAAQPQSQPDWFASWFDSEHYHKLYAHRDEQEAAAFISQVVAWLQPENGSPVLDLGCGAGRHSRYLAALGFDVTGLDLSAESIARAKTSESLNLRFRRQDMRQPFGKNQFHLVLNMFTSFGYFEDPADDVTVVHNIVTSLKAGGYLVLDFMNVIRAESLLKSEEMVERDGIPYRISRWTDADHIFKRISILKGGNESEGAKLEYTERVAKLTLKDFRLMFDLCGLSIEAVFGDYQLSPFRPQASPRLIMIARKTDESLEPALLPREFFADAADGFRSHAQV